MAKKFTALEALRIITGEQECPLLSSSSNSDICEENHGESASEVTGRGSSCSGQDSTFSGGDGHSGRRSEDVDSNQWDAVESMNESSSEMEESSSENEEPECFGEDIYSGGMEGSDVSGSEGSARSMEGSDVCSVQASDPGSMESSDDTGSAYRSMRHRAGRGRSRGSSVRGRGRSRGGSVRGRGRSRGGSVRGRGRCRGIRVRGRGRSSGRSGLDLPSGVKCITVKDVSFCPPVRDFFCPLREPGPHIPDSTEISPLALFELFFDDEVVERIIQSTLAYAEHKKDEMSVSYQNFMSISFTKLELFSYIGCLLLLSLLGVRNHRYGWSTKKAQTVVRLTELMTCAHYELIGTFLHLVTPTEEEELSENRLSKILPLYNYLKSRCSDLYQPNIQLSIDERMVKSKARTHFRQYLRNKLTKWGFKFWILADVTGYTVDFDLYIGKAAKISPKDSLMM